MAADLSTEALLALPDDQMRSGRAALVVLAAPSLQGYPRIGRYVEIADEGYFDWQRALDEGGTWSAGQRLLVQAAAGLWNGLGDCQLSSLLGQLDDANMKRVLLAIEVHRGWRDFRDAIAEAARADTQV